MRLHDEGWKRRKATEKKSDGKKKKRNSTLCCIDAFPPRFYRYFFFPQHSILLSSKNFEKLRKKPERESHSIVLVFFCRALFPVRIRVAAALRSSETNLWEFGSLANEAGDTDAAKSSKLFFPSISSILYTSISSSLNKNNNDQQRVKNRQQ